MIFRNRLFFFFIFLGVIRLEAQTIGCGFDHLRSPDPKMGEKGEEVNKLIFEYLSRNPIHEKSILTIPTVVHVVHQNGPENIPDSIIINGINETNLRLQNSGTFYDASGVDVGIQLCLASVDPSGNPTTGITRTVSSYTDYANFPFSFDVDAHLKNTIRWESSLYLNIWLIKNTNSQLYIGYASFPTFAGMTTDGIVIEAPSFGANMILAHELGHYLGLYHTFQGGCTNFNCMLDGDRVCDTPPDASDQPVCDLNSCSTDSDDTTGLSPFTTDAEELYNYMDYSGCYISFTDGQSARMNATLNTIRNTLLQSNGCGQHPGGPIPVGSFTVGTRTCDGKYPFTSTSINGVGAQWDFNSDGMIDASGNVVNYAFPASGNYSVTIYAAGYGGIDTVTYPPQYYYKSAPYQNYPLVNGFSGLVLSATPGAFDFCPGATVGFFGEPGMASYQWSTGHTTQNLSFQPTGSFTVSLTAVDMNGNSWTSCYPFIVHRVPAPELAITGTDTSFCIGDMITLEAVFGPDLTTSSWYYNQTLIPGVSGTSYSMVLADTNAVYLSQTQNTGCTTLSDTLWIIVDSCSSLSLNSLVDEHYFEVYPNPANEKLNLYWDKSVSKEEITISINQYDGKTIFVKKIDSGSTGLTLAIDIVEWPNGFYLVNFQRESGSTITRKIIITD